MSEERTPYLAGEARPDLETVIVQVLSFSDGSRLRILVDAPARLFCAGNIRFSLVGKSCV